MVARAVAFAAILLVALLLQSVLGAAMTFVGIPPRIVLLTVVGLALQEGPGTGVRYGFVAGLCLDLLSPQGHLVGLSALVLLTVGYAGGLVRPYLTGTDLAGQVTVGATAAALAVLAEGLLSFLLGLATSGLLELVRMAVGAGIYGGVLAPFVCRVVQAVARRVPIAPRAG